MMSQNPNPQDIESWKAKIERANRNNLFHHCQDCGYEWVASEPQTCRCGSSRIERIACWQFPDG